MTKYILFFVLYQVKLIRPKYNKKFKFCENWYASENIQAGQLRIKNYVEFVLVYVVHSWFISVLSF